MATRQRKKSVVGRFVLPCLTLAFLGYFGFHALHGTYGLIGFQAIRTTIDERRLVLDELVLERERLERQVALLGSSSLDRDTVEEYARAQLNVAHPNEVIVLISQQDN
ncbi:MAG: septum formation initiator family protein [Pseudomonadota bacterium]